MLRMISGGTIAPKVVLGMENARPAPQQDLLHHLSGLSVCVARNVWSNSSKSHSKRLVGGVARGLGMVRLQGRLNQQLRSALKDRFKVLAWVQEDAPRTGAQPLIVGAPGSRVS